MPAKMAAEFTFSPEAAPCGALVVPAVAVSSVRLSLIVPTFNERENIREFLAETIEVLDVVLPGAYEIIVVDDDSPDRTWELAGSLGAGAKVRVVRRTNGRGLAHAVIRGWQVSHGEFVGTINADFQHPPEVLARMAQALPDSDLVVASRYTDGGGLGNWRWWRRFTSKAAHRFGLWVLPRVFGRITDPLSGCYIVRRAAIAGVELKPLGYKTLMEITVRGRIETVRECGYQMRDRERGRSKASLRHTFEYLLHLLRLRRDA